MLLKSTLRPGLNEATLSIGTARRNALILGLLAIFILTSLPSGQAFTNSILSNSAPEAGSSGQSGIAPGVENVLAPVLQCNPVQVTSDKDDNTCGTLRGALTYLSTPSNSSRIINFSLGSSSIVTLTGTGLNAPAGITINGPCSNGKPGITINANGVPGAGLTLNGGDTLTGLKVINAGGSQIRFTGNGNRVNCTVANTNPATVQVAGHPRLWFTANDLPRLRSWAVNSNPIYLNGLSNLAATAKARMDAGLVPDINPNPDPNLANDSGSNTYVPYPAEMYAELFAFMSLISPDQATRDDYAGRARTLLMFVMNKAVLGPSPGVGFRDPAFALNDRSRWHGEAYGLTVDWIYPYLSAGDKTTIRTVFLRWSQEILNAVVNGHDHPTPVGTVNDPVLVSDRVEARWAGNNYYTAHMRNLGLMSMALDPQDDAGNQLGNYLGNATGAWLYVFDYLTRNEARGGILPEGLEYSPQTAGYAIQFLLALRTAGRDDPAIYGPQVDPRPSPFWDNFITGYLHTLSPATVNNPELGITCPVYQPAWFGDGERFWAPDLIGAFGPLGIYDSLTGNPNRLATLRWAEINLAPCGPAGLEARARDGNFFTDSILYFMLFDPAASPPPDPHTGRPLYYFDPGVGRLLVRTGWDANATWFTYKLSYNTVDHQLEDGNQFEFYRNGEWLTKERTGYDLGFGSSEYHNTLTLKNNPPDHNDPGEYRNILWLKGSQWAYVPSGNPQLVAYSIKPNFVYATGDATNLYNSTLELSTDIQYANRSILWLKPDHIFIYDRAASATAGRFKRFWLNFPFPITVSGNQSTGTTASKQQLFITTLLPTNAAITTPPYPSSPVPENGSVAIQEPTIARLMVEDTSNPLSIRFLHVLQGANQGSPRDLVSLVRGTAGTPYEGAIAGKTLVLFPVDLTTSFTTLTYPLPAGITEQLITGLVPNSGYKVNTGTPGQITITPGDQFQTDSGGVLDLK